MRVVLAYPYEGRQPNETITVDDAEGRRLVRDGWARHPGNLDDMKLDDMKLDELRDYADRNDIDLGGATKKPDIRAAIDAAERSLVSPTTVLPPSGTE